MDIPSIEKHLNCQFEYASTHNSPSPIKGYDNVVRAFLETLGNRGKNLVFPVSPTRTEKFVTERLKFGLVLMTVKVDLKMLYTASRRAEVHSLIVIRSTKFP